MNVVKVGSRETMRTRRFIFYKSLAITYTEMASCMWSTNTIYITYNLSVCICIYSFSMGFNDLATIGRMSFVRSLQFGIALDTAHQFSPWCGSARPHRCITLSCWAWEIRKRKQINIQLSLFSSQLSAVLTRKHGPCGDVSIKKSRRGVLPYISHIAGTPNDNFRKISVRNTIWNLEFSEHLL